MGRLPWCFLNELFVYGFIMNFVLVYFGEFFFIVVWLCAFDVYGLSLIGTCYCVVCLYVDRYVHEQSVMSRSDQCI